MATFKPAYLIHGDDHGRIAERRARLRALGESESGAQSVELFEGEQSTPEQVALSINTMTFALGRRFIVVDGVERWKDKDLDPLEAALEATPPDMTVAFFAREEEAARRPPRGCTTRSARRAGTSAPRRASRRGSSPSGWSRADASSGFRSSPTRPAR